jgi:hypothetical protein
MQIKDTAIALVAGMINGSLIVALVFLIRKLL